LNDFFGYGLRTVPYTLLESKPRDKDPFKVSDPCGSVTTTPMQSEGNPIKFENQSVEHPVQQRPEELFWVSILAFHGILSIKGLSREIFDPRLVSSINSTWVID
jgi:hypothetical protein